MAKVGRAEVQYCTTPDGVRIAFSTVGSGPALVIVSSVMYSHLNYDSTFGKYAHEGQGFARNLQVVRYDSRGVGLSERVSTQFTLDERLADIDAVADHLGLNEFALLAVIHGTPIAIAYAATRPDRVTRMVLLNPYTDGRAMRTGMKRWDSLRELAAQDWEQYSLTVSNANLSFKDPDRARELANQLRESTTPETLPVVVESLGSIDVGELASSVRSPTLVVRNEGYGGRLPDASMEVASTIPGARLVKTSSVPPIWWGEEEQLAAEDFLGIARTAVLSEPAASAFRAILFTDLVGHSEMMSRLGDERGRTVLREHERITREVLKANGGTEVKTMGDGFMASFGSVTKAVECAVALQRAIGEWQMANGERIEVRCGLNAGEPIEEEGDLFGATVILASRIAAKAEGGEILVADTVRGLCSGKGFLFSDRGEFVAKGFEEPVRVYEVSWRE